ncbi:MAG TPA: CsgG/HfaB family protein [candidate division Zixibacteria bacterium]|jgi:TolB-like protein
MKKQTVTRWTILLGLALGLLAQPLVATADVPESLTQAKKLYNQGKFAEVIDLLTTLAEQPSLAKPEAKEVYLLLAKATAGKSFLDQSEEYLRKVLEIDPDFELDLKVEPPQVQRVWLKVDEERRSGDRPDPGLKTLAVLYFENTSVVDKEKLDGLSKGLSAMLVTDLATCTTCTTLQVVERERIQYILDEIKLEQSEYFEDQSAVRVGKLLGAHVLLMGSFTKLSNSKMRIDARLVKTETGELLKADKVEGKPKDFAKLQAELALKIFAHLDVTIQKSVERAIRDEGRQPLDAVLAYTRGLNYEDEQMLTEAFAAYKEALAAYPGHQAARNRLVALEPLMLATGG